VKSRREDVPAGTDELVLSAGASRLRKTLTWSGQSFLFLVTAVAAVTVLFIFYYIARDAVPFFRLRGFGEFFTGLKWYPSHDPGQYGAVPVFMGSALVTCGAILLAVPLGVSASVCLSDVLPFSVRQLAKPVIEILAAIPSVAFGFFALVVFAPILQNHGGRVLAVGWWGVAAPLAVLAVAVASDLGTTAIRSERLRLIGRLAMVAGLGAAAAWAVWRVGRFFDGLEIVTGANALNVSIILAIMALPTIVSVSEDALQAVGRDLREGSYALGATRSETLLRTIIPAASSGILAAVLLGIMRAIGETMVVLMASGNAAQIPAPWFNLLEPVRTMTATIAGDMGEADHVTGSARYHVLFALGLCLLVFSFVCNLISEWVVRWQRKKLRGE